MNEKVTEARSQFPDTFGLRGFPGERFHINESASYVSGGEVLLYVFTEGGEAFSKGTPAELRRELV